jgi:hypothetical protein
MSFHQNLEMTLSREEFFRLLPAAVGAFQVSGDTIRPAEERPGWIIRLTRLPDRRVGSVAIPRLGVEILLDACSGSEADAFMERFHRAFLRAGG